MYSSRDGRNHLGKVFAELQGEDESIAHRTLVDKVDNVTVSSLVNFYCARSYV